MELCHCTSGLVEHLAAACPHLKSITATTIKSGSVVDLINFGNNLTELKLRSMSVSNLLVLGNLPNMKQLSITSIKNMEDVLPVVGKMTQLEALELGEMTNITESSVVAGFLNLTKLKRLRLEKGQQNCPTDKIMETISQLPTLVELELINFDLKGQFIESLSLCSNIKILLIIPTYDSQVETTTYLVIYGLPKLAPTLNHFIWGITLECLRMTDLLVSKWELKQMAPTPETQAPKMISDRIPVLKPSVRWDANMVTVDVLDLPHLLIVLSTLLPTTKIVLLKMPFSSTWRQTIASTIQ